MYGRSSAQDVTDAIEVEGLVREYGSLKAVDGIDLRVRRGEVFAFLGPNGAGKTTTVEILEGLRPRTAGKVRVLGLDPWTDRRSLIPRLGIIPQDFNFFPKITPTEALRFSAGVFGRPVDVRALLRRVQLEDKARSLYENLSGGQKQKLGLALALAHEPELLFLDEPTTGLDPQARRAIWEVIRSLRKEGRTIFLTTHYLEEAQTLADRVAIIDRGRLRVVGTPEEIIQRHGTGDRLRIQGGRELAQALRSRLEQPVGYEDGYVEVGLRRREDLFAIMEAVRDSGLPWGEVSTRRDTLEDVFLRLVSPEHRDELRLPEAA
jgi:ABC-2 type transport system ATP-binding protein